MVSEVLHVQPNPKVENAMYVQIVLTLCPDRVWSKIEREQIVSFNFELLLHSLLMRMFFVFNGFCPLAGPSSKNMGSRSTENLNFELYKTSPFGIFCDFSVLVQNRSRMVREGPRSIPPKPFKQYQHRLKTNS